MTNGLPQDGLQLARGSSGGDNDEAANDILAMLGYELPPFIDEAEAWRPPQDFRLPRYVARRNRMVGGLVVTVKLLAQVPLAQCTKRFARVGNDCYHRDGCGTAALLESGPRGSSKIGC